MRLTVLNLCFFFLLAGTALAAQAAPPPGGAANRIPGPMVLPQAWPGGDSFPTGLFAVMNHVSIAHLKPYKHSSRHTIRTPFGNKVGPRKGFQFVDVVKFRYGLAWDRLEIRTATPYISADIKNHTGDGDWKGGIGDTTVMLRYGVKKRSDASPFSAALDLGVTVPTGEVGDKDKYLATNAFSVIMGGGVSWVDKNQRLDFDGRYAAYTEGAHSIKPGDFALFHGHYAYALSRNFDLGMEGYYRIDQQTEINGKGQRDAATECYIGPKVQIKVPEWSYMMVGAAVLFPVYRDYQAVKMAPDTRYEFSILFAF